MELAHGGQVGEGRGLLASQRVERSLLVRVLAVAQLERFLQAKRELVRKQRFTQPAGDARVIGSGERKRFRGQPAACRLRHLVVQLQLRQHDVVVGRLYHHRYRLVVLGRGTQQRDAADVDQLDGGLAGEGIEVADDDVDRGDAVALKLLQVLGLVAPRQDAAVDGGVQSLDAPVEYLRKTGDVRHFTHWQAREPQRAGGAAAGDKLYAELFKPPGKRNEADFVVNRKDGSHNVFMPWAGRRLGALT